MQPLVPGDDVTDRSESRILVGYNQFLCGESLAIGGKFSLSLLEDLNTLIESVVLYDQIVLLGKYSLRTDLLTTPLKQAGILKAITEADVRSVIADEAARACFVSSMVDVFGPTVLSLDEAQPERLLERRIPPDLRDQGSINLLFEQTIECARHGRLFERRRFRDWIARNIVGQRDCRGHFCYLARAVLYGTYAERAGMDYAPDILRLPIAALTFSKGAKAIPKALYDALVGRIRTEVEDLAGLGMPMAVFVPPLTARVLSNVSSPEDYPDELLAVREEFSGFRSTYRDFIAMVRNPHVALKDKIDAKKKMVSRITGVVDKGESHHALNVRMMWEKLIGASVGDGGLSAGLSLSGLASCVFDQLAAKQVRGRARALFDLWTDTLNLKNYGKVVEDAFGITIDPREADLHRRYTNSVRRLIRRADETAEWRQE